MSKKKLIVLFKQKKVSFHGMISFVNGKKSIWKGIINQ